MTQAIKSSVISSKYYSLALLVLLTTASILLWDVSWAQWILFPIRTFVTAVHELGHATVCLATGGTVAGLTIVSDNNGHGGVTMCRGGWPLLYTQTGYLGTAFFGCLLIWLGRYRRAAKAVLILMGLTIGAASVTLMTGTIFNGGSILQGLGSIAWGLILGVGLIWSGLKLKPAIANFLLLFLAVQTALNALTDVVVLTKLSLGMYPTATFSDAGGMAQITGIPAAFWSLLWGVVSVVMLAFTLWFCYRPQRRRMTV